MRVYLSVDLEGISGIVHSSQTQPGEPGYQRAIELMHADTNAVIQGALAAGARSILVNDAHWDMRNLCTELLHPQATLITGWQKPFSMMSGVNEGSDVAVFVGYHAAAGSARGVLSHTYRSQVFLEVKLNGRTAGETLLNAALAGWFGVPVALITGDDALCKEAQEGLGPVATVEVKKAVSRYAAVCQPHQQVLDALVGQTTETLKQPGSWQLIVPPRPSTLTITLIDPAMADGAELLPFVRRTGARDIEVTHENYSTLFQIMLAIGAIASSRKDTYF